ncbi:MAG TPA: homoserine dehydrogenase [Actinomycetota bacterium]|jgi:homoserine dehydrogenase
MSDRRAASVREHGEPSPAAPGVPVVRVGVVGLGNVGAALVRLLDDTADDIAERAGFRLEVTRAVVRDPARSRGVPLDPGRIGDDPAALVADTEVDVVCELIGGVDPAKGIVLDALGRGKPVVTANKELLATMGRDLFDVAEQRGVDLAFEGAVGGGIPLVRALKESLAGERVTRVVGIVNGTTNLILTRMAEDGVTFEEALDEAQRLGYAEADPSADVDGHDAAAKCAILASIAFNARVVASDVFREGIGHVTPVDFRTAKELGFVIKPVAIAELEEGDVAVRVHPAMLPADHPLAAVREAFNAVFVEGERAGQLMLYGRGAGGDPTATAVAADLIRVGRNLVLGGRAMGCTCYLDRRIRPMDDMEAAYYLLLDVEDRPGVLATVAGTFGAHGVSIKSVLQEDTGAGAQLVMITHRAREGALQATVRELGQLEPVHAVRSVLRVEQIE